MCSRAALDVTPRPSLCKRSAAQRRAPARCLESRAQRGFQGIHSAQITRKKTQNGPARGHKKGRSGLAAARARRVCHGSDQPPRGSRKPSKRNAPALYKNELLALLARCMTCAYHLPAATVRERGKVESRLQFSCTRGSSSAVLNFPGLSTSQEVLFLKGAIAPFRKSTS